MAKKMKFQRSGARDKSAIPPAPPSPEETQAIAQAGEHLNRGNSNQLPLAPEGQAEIQQVGEKLAAKGGLDSIKTPPGDVRSNQTAQILASADPKHPTVGPDGDMQSWAQGNLEGMPAKDVKGQIRDLVRNNPTYVIPGQGAMSTRPGESFDDFRQRGLGAVRGMMQELAQNPSAKIGRTTHSQVIKLARGWIAKGTPDDLSIDPNAMDQEQDKPGSVMHLYPDNDGNWQMSEVNLDDKTPLQPGGYLIRHGLTPWNKETYEKQNAANAAAAKISQYAPALDFGRVRATATKAAYDGHMTDDQISDAIDASLPSAEQAKDMPWHHILAIASAASPKKQAEYAPLLAAMQQADGPPDAKAAIARHISMISPQGAVRS